MAWVLIGGVPWAAHLRRPGRSAGFPGNDHRRTASWSPGGHFQRTPVHERPAFGGQRQAGGGAQRPGANRQATRPPRRTVAPSWAATTCSMPPCARRCGAVRSFVAVVRRPSAWHRATGQWAAPGRGHQRGGPACWRPDWINEIGPAARRAVAESSAAQGQLPAQALAT